MSEPWLPARALLARRLWDENRVALEDLCAGIAEAFRLPVDAVAATVKRRLMMDVSEGRCGRLRPSLSQAFARASVAGRFPFSTLLMWPAS